MVSFFLPLVFELLRLYPHESQTLWVKFYMELTSHIRQTITAVRFVDILYINYNSRFLPKLRHFLFKTEWVSLWIARRKFHFLRGSFLPECDQYAAMCYSASFPTLVRISIESVSAVRFSICSYSSTIKPLETKGRPHYLKTQSVPRCKHFSSRL